MHHQPQRTAAHSGRSHRSRRDREDRHHRRHEIRVRRPDQGRKDRDEFFSGKNKQNAVKSMVVTDGEGRVLWCSPTKPASCVDITHARQLGLVGLLARRAFAVEILADAGCQGLGARTGGRSDATAPQVQEERPGLV
ncbi:transposase family protein [Streptomyces sp. NPDC058155]|uniref:transposase family protein n=1 Tax=Streptomyces sp. NPDC058155 TaxID=3346359 RepID=UPI0036EBFE2F